MVDVAIDNTEVAERLNNSSVTVPTGETWVIKQVTLASSATVEVKDASGNVAGTFSGASDGTYQPQLHLILPEGWTVTETATANAGLFGWVV